MHRNDKIDNIRAIAILVVVFGHSIILYSSAWNLYETTQKSIVLDYLKEFINIFQMPLFFSLSGYLLSIGECKVNYVKFIVKKAMRLLIPFVLVGILFVIPLKKLLHYPGYKDVGFLSAIEKLFIGSETGHLWYLPTLFLIMCVSYWLIKISRKKSWIMWVALFGAVAIHLVCNKIPRIIPYQYQVLNYLWCFLFGAAIHKFKLDHISGKAKYLIGVLTVIIGFLAVWFRESNFLVAMAIIITTYLFAPEGKNAILNRLSKDSFGIYLFHSPLIYITFTYMLNVEPIITVGVNFFLWGGIAIAITEVIRLTKLKFIIGE